MNTQTVVRFTSIDGTHFRMLAAKRLAYTQGDPGPENIAKEFALALYLYWGLSRPSGQESYLVQVRLTQITTGATKSWGAEAADPTVVLSAVDQFDVRRLLPDGLPEAEHKSLSQQLQVYFERSKAGFREEAKQEQEIIRELAERQ
jgi:hypothetical protein